MISLENRKILTPLQKLPKNNGDLGKLIVAKGTGTFFRRTYYRRTLFRQDTFLTGHFFDGTYFQLNICLKGQIIFNY